MSPKLVLRHLYHSPHDSDFLFGSELESSGVSGFQTPSLHDRRFPSRELLGKLAHREPRHRPPLTTCHSGHRSWRQKKLSNHSLGKSHASTTTAGQLETAQCLHVHRQGGLDLRDARLWPLLVASSKPATLSFSAICTTPPTIPLLAQSWSLRCVCSISTRFRELRLIRGIGHL